MSRRITSLQDVNVGIARDINSKYDAIKYVADNFSTIAFLESALVRSLSYLGASTGAPSTRLDSSDIEDGDYYLETTDGIEGLMYYDLSSDVWISASAGGGSGVSSVNAKTGVVVLNKADIDLQNVDNTSDVNKPISTIQQQALDGKLDSLAQLEIDLNTAKVSNVNHPIVEKYVPANALFTDTTYTVGNGQLSEKNFTGTEKTKLESINFGAEVNEVSAADLATKANISHSHTKSDISDFVEQDYATFSQGGKADSALQSGANISTLINDSQFITLNDVPAESGEVNTASSDGAGVSLVKVKVGSNLPFKSFLEGSGITIDVAADTLTFNSTASGGGEVNTSSSLGTGVAIAASKSGSNLPFKSLVQGQNVTISSDINHVTISSVDTTYSVGDNGLTQKNFTASLKTKLDGVEASANNYSHPANHLATVITQTSDHRFVSDTEKSTWNAKISDISSQSLKELSDVFTAMVPVDGQILTFDSTNGWQAQNAPSGGVVSWGDLAGTLSSQTDLQTALNNKADDLDISNSNNWDTAYTHSQVSHAPSNADNTSANETSHAAVDAHMALVDEHTDWSLTNVKNIHADNYVNSDTTYSALSEFSNDTLFISGIAAESVGDLVDVDLTGVSAGKILEWNGTKFISADKAIGGTTTFTGLSDTPTDFTGSTGKFVQSTGSQLVFVDAPLDAVQTVFGRSGSITAQVSDYSSFYATAAQGISADNAIPNTEKGANSGVATLNSSGIVTSGQLPALIQLGEVSTSAYRGDRGTTAYNHTNVLGGNPHNVTASEVGAEVAFNKNTGFNKDFGVVSGTVAEGDHNHSGQSGFVKTLVVTEFPVTPEEGTLYIKTVA